MSKNINTVIIIIIYIIANLLIIAISIIELVWLNIYRRHPCVSDFSVSNESLPFVIE
jgi:hypothetical protein